jgi:hypothetical protein
MKSNDIQFNLKCVADYISSLNFIIDKIKQNCNNKFEDIDVEIIKINFNNDLLESIKINIGEYICLFVDLEDNLNLNKKQ